MVVRVVVLLGLALIIGVGTIIFAKRWIDSQPAQIVTEQVQVARADHFVLVASRDLYPGMIMGKDSVRWQGWPTDDTPSSYVVQGQRNDDEFVGAVVRTQISSGEPISDRKVAKPGEGGFLAAVLSPGMRAVTVPISDTRQAAGFILPGDRIDVILTHGGGGAVVAETVFRDMRLIAIDQVLRSADTTPRVGRTATLEVTPREAEAFNVMLQMGTISLSLRSLRLGEEEQRLLAEEQRQGGDQAAMLAGTSSADKAEEVDKTPTVNTGQVLPLNATLDEHAVRRQDQTFTSGRDVSVLIGGGGNTNSVVVIRGNASR